MTDAHKRQKTAIIYARVKPEVKALLEEQAKDQGRNLTNYLEWLVRQHSQPAPPRSPANGR